MMPKLIFEELAIAITAKNHNPTLLTPDFLICSGIVPSNWELLEPPILDSQMCRVQFTNSTIISAQVDTVTFSQTIEGKALEDIQLPTLVRKYIETLPNIDYQGIGINPSSFFAFEDEGETANCNYIVTALLSPGDWHEFGSQPVRATLSLAYTLKQGEFNLKIDDVKLRRPDNTPQAAVLFSGNFPYEISGGKQERLQNLYKLILNWQDDLKTYRELVNQRFYEKLVH
ncbi:MAG: hypothetical protein V7K97_18795 [Nostoc sp.]